MRAGGFWHAKDPGASDGDCRKSDSPVMYLALSYDHRVIDGKEAVTFLVRSRKPGGPAAGC